MSPADDRRCPPYLLIDATAAGTRITGIERYSIEVTRAIEGRLGAREGALVVLQSRDASWMPCRSATRVIRCPLRGRLATEQAWIPILSARLRPRIAFFPAFAPSPLALAALAGRPVVGTVHDAVPWTHAGTTSWKTRAYFRPQATYAMHRYALVHTVSHASRADLVRVFPDVEGRIVVSGNGVDFARFSMVSREDRLRARARLELPERYLLTVGTIEPRKNLPFLLGVLATLRDASLTIPLVVVGRFGWGTDEVRGAIDRLGLGDQVMLLGAVEDAYIPALYAEAWMLAMPSVHEGFGLPLVEAMAAGTPVIASRSPAIAEVVGDAGTTVAVDDADAWRRALSEGWTLSRQRERWVDAGREQARSFSWDAVAGRILASFDGVAGP